LSDLLKKHTQTKLFTFYSVTTSDHTTCKLD